MPTVQINAWFRPTKRQENKPAIKAALMVMAKCQKAMFFFCSALNTGLILYSSFSGGYSLVVVMVKNTVSKIAAAPM